MSEGPWWLVHQVFQRFFTTRFAREKSQFAGRHTIWWKCKRCHEWNGAKKCCADSKVDTLQLRPTLLRVEKTPDLLLRSRNKVPVVCLRFSLERLRRWRSRSARKKMVATSISTSKHMATVILENRSTATRDPDLRPPCLRCSCQSRNMTWTWSWRCKGMESQILSHHTFSQRNFCVTPPLLESR